MRGAQHDGTTTEPTAGSGPGADCSECDHPAEGGVSRLVTRLRRAVALPPLRPRCLAEDYEDVDVHRCTCRSVEHAQVVYSTW